MMLEFISSIIVSLGGLTACVILIVKFGGNKLAELLSKKYSHKLDKRMEEYKLSLDKSMAEYKAQLDKDQESFKLELSKQLASHQSSLEGKIYVSKNRFDKEFNIIQEFLSQYYEFTHMLWTVNCNREKSEEEFAPIQKEMNDKVIEFSRFYLKNQVLINKDLSEIYKGAVELLEKFRQNMNYSRGRFLRYKDKIYDEEGRMLDAYATHCLPHYEEMDEIHDEVNKGEKFGYYHLVDVSRDYLNKLDIVETPYSPKARMSVLKW